jgi:hypothetical protein
MTVKIGINTLNFTLATGETKKVPRLRSAVVLLSLPRMTPVFENSAGSSEADITSDEEISGKEFYD